MIIVKRGFDYEKIFYKAGVKVSEEIAKLFPENVKRVGEDGVETSEVVEQPIKGTEDELRIDEVSDRLSEPKPVLKAKKRPKKAKKR